MSLTIPLTLSAACEASSEGICWLHDLPVLVNELAARWSLDLGRPFESSSCAWVAPAEKSDGQRVVLKVGMPHMEAKHEIEGLRFWAGNPTVHLLDGDVSLNAMVLERCNPGTSLRLAPETVQDRVIAALLERMWRVPETDTPFRPLRVMTDFWCEATRADRAKWPDAALVEEGLAAFDELSDTSPQSVLLATDLHAGNVLRSEREPWLVIDPKPFLGDPAYDTTQHLMNCRARLLSDPHETIRSFAEVAGIDARRARRWLFARAAAEPGSLGDSQLTELAYMLRA